MDVSTLKSQSRLLQSLTVNSELNRLVEQQGSYEALMTKVHQLKKNTATLNREFDERFKETEGLYKLPFFGTNQDILLLGFYFSYLVLMIVMLIIYYKNTQSWQNTLYGAVGSIFALMIISGLLFRLA
jgi:hypothetical protein